MSASLVGSEMCIRDSYIIKVKAKTCFEDETGTLMDCKVKVKDPPS